MFWEILSSGYMLSLLLISAWMSHLILGDTEWRLPTIIRPLNYNIRLEIPEAAFTDNGTKYFGYIVIDMQASESSSQIKLHASPKYLEPLSVSLEGTNIDKNDYSIDYVTEVFSIKAPFDLSRKNTFQLIVNYTGNVNIETLYGFYKASYVTNEGTTRYLLTTQFESTHARKAFPCFDEPSFKSTFEMIITYPRGYMAVFNTPGSLVSGDEFSETMQFEKTVIMSTYLVAYIISDFTCTDGKSIGKVSYSVCSRPDTSSLRDYALEIGPKALATFNEYTDFDFGKSMPKLHQMAITDFAAGAMENWGLITYRETSLLWDPKECTMENQKFVANVIIHEFAHSWFGNLVTCQWWSVLFLNEGFAKLFEYLVSREVYPSWDMDDQYVVDIKQAVFLTDSLRSAVPLESEVQTPEEASLMFSIISYYKGSAVLRMTMNIMGYTAFRDGLRNYFKKFKYSTAQPEDLWQSLENVIDKSYSKLPVDSLAKILQNWIKLSGYPLLKVTVEGLNITVEQERFLLLENDSSSKWYVPLSYTTSADTNRFESTGPQLWLSAEAKKSFQITQNEYNWFLINGQTGYFRVIYDFKNQENIRKALLKQNFDGIPEVERAIIIDDMLSAASIGRIKYRTVFKFIEFTAKDQSYYTWSSVAKHFIFMLNTVGRDTRLGKAMEKRFQKLINTLYESTSFGDQKEDDLMFNLKQKLALETACSFGTSTCIETSKTLLHKYKSEGIRPLKNVRNIVYCVALHNSDDTDDWQFLYDVYNQSKNIMEKAVLRTALGCFSNKQILTRYLEEAAVRSCCTTQYEKNPPDFEEVTQVFRSLYKGSTLGAEIALQFLENKRYTYQDVYHRLSTEMISEVEDVYLTQEHIEKVIEGIKYVENIIQNTAPGILQMPTIINNR